MPHGSNQAALALQFDGEGAHEVWSELAACVGVGVPGLFLGRTLVYLVDLLVGKHQRISVTGRHAVGLNATCGCVDARNRFNGR